MKKYQLPRQFAEKWVEALRSGEYKPAFACYKKGDCFCAIGLGYHVNGYKLQDGGNDLIDVSSDFIYDKIIGLWKSVTKMSDAGTTFPEIATWLEQNVEFI